MEILLQSSAEDPAAYDRWVKTHPQGTLWQSPEWKAYQEALGRETRVYLAMSGGEIVGGALVIIDRTSFGLSAWDIPRGPLWTNEQAAHALINRIRADARADRCLNLYYSPTTPTLNSLAREAPAGAKWAQFPGPRSPARAGRSGLNSSRTEQPEATRILDLTLDDETLLAQMHQKGRYNIRVAQKNDIRVAESTDVEAYAALARQTAARDRYKGAPARQYKAFLEHLPGSFLLLAYAPDEAYPIAGLLGVIWPTSGANETGATGIYYYGASDYAHRALMAPYALQWEAIRRCRAAGCTRYDLLGVAPPGADADHPWQGITSFKEKFGGTLVTYPPEQRIPFRPVLRGMLAVKRKVFG